MLTLGIETATERVSVALGDHDGVLGSIDITRGRRHAETLTPAIEFLCRQADVKIDEVAVVAVDVGPGLFTGMRVGIAAAKAIGGQALRLDGLLQEAVTNTAALKDLETTIEYATTITAGLNRGRTRLGG